MDLLPPSPTGPEIKAARLAVGLSQSAAAELVGYSLRGWQDAEASGAPKLHAATWAFFLLATGQHSGYALKRR
ncbi:MAG: XRE family transcriptional regulator [Burkholderiaceae bacterium]